MLRVLHLPTGVGGNSWALSRAERSHGLKSDVLIRKTSIYSNKYDILLPRKRNSLVYAMDVTRFYANAVKNYDVFHFNFGQTLVSSSFSLLDMIDLTYLKKKNKGIFVTFQGSDARIASYCVQNHEITYFNENDVLKGKRNERLKLRRIKKFDAYADGLYTTNPDLLSILPERTKFRPYTKINLEEWDLCELQDFDGEELIVGHAPSNRKIKGTHYVVEAVESLKKEGYPIKLLLLENIPNSDARTFYKQADIFVDQLLSGWYGGISVEVMALGKPVIVYLRETDLLRIPEEMRADLPFIKSSPHDLVETLRRCFVNREMLRAKSALSRSYVEKWHDSKKNALQIIADYEMALKSKQRRRE